MDFLMIQDALREQQRHPTDRRVAERAIGGGLIRWADWCDAVQRGEGAAGTIRGAAARQQRARRSQFSDLDVDGHGELWPLVEIVTLTRLSQANVHVRAMGTLLYHVGLNSSVRALLRVHAEACMRGVWIGDPEMDARTALHRAVAEFAHEANSIPAPQRRKLHDEMIRPLAEAVGLTLHSRKGGRWTAGGTVRPDTRALIGNTAALGETFVEFPLRSYGLQTAAVHSSLQGWVVSVLDSDEASLRTLSLDLLQAIAVHHRLETIYEGWHDWRPQDLMDSARQSSLSSVSLALLNVEAAASGAP